MANYRKMLARGVMTACFCASMAFPAFAEEESETPIGWVETDDGWMYYDDDGYYVTNEWKKSGDNWFYLGDDGYVLYDQIIEHEDYIYYANEDGAMVKNQWVQRANEEYDDGENAAVDIWYYFQNNGRAYIAGDRGTSFKTINGEKYAFDSDGRMLWGWVNDVSEMCNEGTDWQTAMYYCGAEDDGARKSGWQFIDVEENRENLEKNKDDDSVMYYYFYFREENGKRVQDTTRTINGQKYSFDEYGAMDYEWTMATDSIASLSTATASVYQFFNYEDYGNRVSGWIYAIPSENMHKKEYDDEMEHWYYATGGGNLVVGQFKTIDGKRYAFNQYGEMLYGLQALKLNDSDPTIIEDSYLIDDESELDAYMNRETNFSGDSGTFNFDGTLLYYFGDDSDDGAMKTGKVKVEFTGDNYNYYFIKTGDYKGAAFGSLEMVEGTYKETDDGEYVFIDDGKYIYREGRRMEADEDLKYEAFDAWGVKPDNKDDVADGRFYLVNTSGSIQKKKENLKDRDGYYYCTDAKGVITYRGDEKCQNHSDTEQHS